MHANNFTLKKRMNQNAFDALKRLISKESGNSFIGSFVGNDWDGSPHFYLIFFDRANIERSWLDYRFKIKTNDGSGDDECTINAIVNVFSDGEFTRIELSDFIFSAENLNIQFDMQAEMKEYFEAFLKEKGTHEHEIVNGAFLALEHSEKLFYESSALVNH